MESPADFWKPLLISAGLFIGFVLLHVLAFILFSLTASKTGESKNIHNFHRWFMINSLRLFFHLENVKIHTEGTVNKSAKGLLPFRNGAFKIAKKAKVPIVVAVIANTRKINENLLNRRTHVYLKILDVIPYEEIAGLKTNEIGEKVSVIMLKALEEENK